MADEFLKWATGTSGGGHYSIAPGIVINNLDFLAEGRVEVRIPSHPRFSPLARLVGAGSGSGKGFFWVPQIKDEVLVAFHQGDLRDAYIVGGLWSTLQRTPIVDPIRPLMKRVIKTGLLPGIGHEIEFDDALQSITIKTPLEDKVEIGPGKVEISTAAGLLSISLNLMATPPKVSIESTLGNIELSAPMGKISLSAMQVEINGTATAELKSEGVCTVQGSLVKIN